MRGTIGRLLHHDTRRRDEPVRQAPAEGLPTVDRLVAIAEELDARDPAAARHSCTVGRYAGLIAAQLEFDEASCHSIHLAGLLHDIGKLGVHDAILQKPGPLTEPEWEAMREHPRAGAEILFGAGFPDLAAWVRAHHERPDGSGYPYGLAGDEIPVEARILAVADSYEAMTNDRVYRRAIPHEEARLELRQHCGAQFDEVVVEAFVTCGATTRIGSGRWRPRRRVMRPRVRWS